MRHADPSYRLVKLIIVNHQLVILYKLIEMNVKDLIRFPCWCLRIEVEESLVNGSFSMYFLRHRVTLHYRNHKNVIMR
jgi:hypothetical protein